MSPPSRARRAAYIVKAGIQTLKSRDFGATLATVQDGLDIRAFVLLAQEMRQTEDGRWLLTHQPRVDTRSLDPARLASLPDGTLGREAYRHLSQHGLLRDVEIPPSPFPLPADAVYAKTRWRETHDFRHVLTGLGVSIRDEIVLQAFQLGQFHNRFAVFQMTFGPVLAPCHPGALARDYLRAWRAGRRAARLISVRWETLLDRPVEALRRDLGVERLGDVR